MKKYFISVMAVAASLFAMQGQSKLDMGAHRLLDSFRGEAPELREHSDARLKAASARGGRTLLLVMTDGSRALDAVESLGCTVVGLRGGVAVVDAPLSAIEDIASIDGVVHVSAGETLKPMLDAARKDSKADQVQAGTGLETSYSGRGVVTGIFDGGFDVNHVNFLSEDLSSTRVKRLWHYDNYGECTEYDTPAEIMKFSTDDATGTHGTHVLGIMSGGYKGNATFATKGLLKASVKENQPMPYYGVATSADIAVGCGPLATTLITDGIERMIGYARAENKPLVVNLSLGQLEGPQDGTDAAARYLADLGKDAVIVIAAGNDGGEPLTVSKTFTDTDREVRTCIALDASKQSGAFEIWGSDAGIYTVKFGIVNLSTGRVLSTFDLTESTAGETAYLTTSNYTAPEYNHDSNFDTAFQSSNLQIRSNVSTTNNRYQVQVTYSLTPNSTTNRDLELALAVIVEGKPSQRVDLKILQQPENEMGYFTANRMAGWADGSDVMSISGMACGDNVIVAGSYNTRISWATLSKDSYTYTQESGLTTVGDVSAFTSSGVTVTGKSLPDVCAPGAAIVSSYSSYYVTRAGLNDKTLTGKAVTADGRTHWWARDQGTSMACPHISGVAALWLEADPSLDVNEIRSIMKSTAVSDKFVSDATKWGAGKLDALAGLKEVLQRKSGIGSVFADDESALVVRDLGAKRYNVFVAGERSIDVSLTAMSGATVVTVAGAGNDMTLDASAVAPGVYILAVDGANSRLTRKIVIR